MRPDDTLSLLQAYESPNVTFIEADGSWPIVWARAKGVHVWDAAGKRYLDLTAAFGVAAAGHANARVVKAGQRQMSRLLHAMGDVHPHRLKAELARELSRLTFQRWSAAGQTSRLGVGPQAMKTGLVARLGTERGIHSAVGIGIQQACGMNSALRMRQCFSGQQSKTGNRATAKTIFCNSGFEAVEAALKTALLATGKPGVIAFEGAYHGLGYGALNATHRDYFRSPFRQQLGEFGRFVPFPTTAARLEETGAAIRRRFEETPVGAILVEPIQGRGGIRVPPPEFLPLLRRVCDEHGALLIADEIYTAPGRTGAWFACEHSRTVPDLICLGKALTGGFPLSACVGRADLMDAAWPKSTGEALHTSTFLGHPVGCAMALAQIEELRRRRLLTASARLGKFLLERLSQLHPPKTLMLSRRGCGLMAGLELRQLDGAPATDAARRVLKLMLQRGFILLPEGEHANVLSFTPPLIITERQLAGAVDALQAVLQQCAR